jgi:hypothetical protein
MPWDIVHPFPGSADLPLSERNPRLRIVLRQPADFKISDFSIAEKQHPKYPCNRRGGAPTNLGYGKSQAGTRVPAACQPFLSPPPTIFLNHSDAAS